MIKSRAANIKMDHLSKHIRKCDYVLKVTCIKESDTYCPSFMWIYLKI